MKIIKQIIDIAAPKIDKIFKILDFILSAVNIPITNTNNMFKL